MSEKKQNQSNRENTKKNPSAMNDFADRLREDKKFAAIVGGSILAVIVIIVLICVFAGKKKDETGEGGTVSDNEVSANGIEGGAVSEPEGAETVPDADAAAAANPMDIVNNLVDTYFAALTSGDVNTIKAIKNHSEEEELLKIEKRSAYIESFENVNVYTKPGPVDRSYVAFVYYEIKFKDLNTTAPGLITLYMSTGEDGNLYIYDGQLDEQLDESVVDYIKELAVTEEIVALFDKVKVKYNEALDQDPELKAFMDGLSDRMEAEVNAEMAQRKEQAEGAAKENEQPAESSSQTSETVVATDTVNVRSSDSENADKLGKLEIGTKVTRHESKENGWSRIDYNGQEAYVKSEYLKVDDGTVPEQPSNEQAASTESNASSSGEKVTVKETVRVRKSASTDGKVLGTVYMGETFELIMKQADGWTKIKYNGQTGYIKSEYLE